MNRISLLAACLLPFACVARAQAPALVRIGAAAAVSGMVKALAPGTAVGRVVQSGKPLYLNDHVTTDARGRLQVLLLDETVFTLGPNSDMTLDEFVYDPKTGAGKVTANIVKGTFRFVSGKAAAAAPESTRIRMPIGIMGIRGTMVAGQVDGQSSTLILLGPGAGNNAGETPGRIVLTNAGDSVVIDRPGFGTIMLPGQPPAPPADYSARLSAIVKAVGPSDSSPSDGRESARGPDRDSGPAGEEAGQATASAGKTAWTARDSRETAESFVDHATQASQDNSRTGGAVADGTSDWDQIRSLVSGVGTYTGSGSYTCSGGSYCSAGATGAMSFMIDVDFNARTIGSAQSYIILEPINYPSGFGGDSTYVPATSFSNLSGSAVIVNPGNSSGSTFNSKFDGTSITLLNHDGIPAKDIKVDVVYDGAFGETVSGTMSGKR